MDEDYATRQIEIDDNPEFSARVVAQNVRADKAIFIARALVTEFDDVRIFIRNERTGMICDVITKGCGEEGETLES